MRTIKILEHISLDGVIQAPNGTEAGYDRAGWSDPYDDPAGVEGILAAQGDRFDLLLGRQTYDLWASYWPTADAPPIELKLVSSKTLSFGGFLNTFKLAKA